MAEDNEFTGNYGRIYEAGLARLRRSEARQRGRATQAAGRAGVATSGVSLIPQEAIGQSALEAETALGGEVAGMAEQERLGERRFQQQMEMLDKEYSLREAAERRAASRRKGALGRQLIATGIGGLTAGAGGALAEKYF